MKLITNKSKNLLDRIVDAGNVIVQFSTSYAVVTQRTADTNTNIQYKCQYRKDDAYLRDVFVGSVITSTGKITARTFTTPADLDYNTIVFGLNGATIDTLVAFNIKLKPSTTYTFTCNFTNITQGSISWKDMMLVEGSTAGEYEPYSYNLLDKWKYPASTTISGVTFTNNGDGSITANGTATADTWVVIQSNINLTSGRKMLLVGSPEGGGENIYKIRISIFNDDIGSGKIFTVDRTPAECRLIVGNGITANNLTFIPQLYDLTLMYGEGNEPTTVNQFYTDHPELKVAPLGFIGLKNLEISNKNIKRLRYPTTTKNLLDPSKFKSSSGTVSVDGDKISIIVSSGYTSDTFAFFCTVSVKKNTNYTISVQDHTYDIPSVYIYTDRIFGNLLTNGSFPLKFNSRDNESLVIGFYSLYSRRQPNVAGWVQGPMLEEGSTATSYVPYGYLDLGVIPSKSGYILNEYNNLTEELLTENVELPSGSWNNSLNILDKSSVPSTNTISGITVTDNGNGSLNAFGTAVDSGGGNSWGITAEVVKNHIYFTNSIYDKMSLILSLYNSESTYFFVRTNIFTFTLNSGKYRFGYNLSKNATYDLDIYPQIIDLTSLYGAGNEPSTVDEFYNDYPGLKNNINTYHIPDKTNISLNKVEGKTNKIVQLLDRTKYPSTTTISGVTWTNNSNGTVTANGTATANSIYNFATNINTLTTVGHKYLIIGCPEGGESSTKYFLRYDSNGGTAAYDIGSGAIFTKTAESTSYVNARIVSGYTATKLIFSPQLFDLTAMYGFGKEPTTVEQFKKDYPQFFDEKLDGIWDAAISGISTTGKNLFDIDSVSFFTKDSNDEYKSNKYIYTTDVLWTPKEGANQVTISGYIKCPVGKNYHFRFIYTDGISQYKSLTSTGNYVYQTSTSDASKTLSYVELGYYSVSNEVYIKDVQIEEGSAATTYEPYTENKIDFSSVQGIGGIDGNNDYIEIIDKGNGLYDLNKVVAISYVNLGTLNWEKSTVFYINTASFIKPNTYGLCKEFQCVPSTVTISGEDYLETCTDNYLYFRYTSDSTYKDMTTAQFKAAMSGVQLAYQRATPYSITLATNLTYSQVSALRTNGGLLLVNDNNNQKYVQPSVTIKSNYQYIN